MSILIHWWHIMLTKIVTSSVRAPTPDTMSLHDWADLPAYHPICDRTPR